MKSIIITPSSSFRRLSLLAPRYFKIPIKKFFELSKQTKEKEKIFTEHTKLKINSSLVFHNVISAYEASKLFFTSWDKRENFEIFLDIIKDQNPYLNQLRGMNYIGLPEKYRNYTILFWLIEKSLENETELKFLLKFIQRFDIEDFSIKDNYSNIYNNIEISINPIEKFKLNSPNYRYNSIKYIKEKYPEQYQILIKDIFHLE